MERETWKVEILRETADGKFNRRVTHYSKPKKDCSGFISVSREGTAFFHGSGACASVPEIVPSVLASKCQKDKRDADQKRAIQSSKG